MLTTNQIVTPHFLPKDGLIHCHVSHIYAHFRIISIQIIGWCINKQIYRLKIRQNFTILKSASI